ncbi:hypothetical protein F783_014840 [Bordetella holmesii F627]|nr:hypothetical protein F783_014840 [Bordetella holmesii F627]
MFNGIQAAGAAHAAHDLVSDEQHAVTVAYLAHLAEVAWNGRYGACRGTDHRFGHEGHDGCRSQCLESLLQFGGQAIGVMVVSFSRQLVPIGIARRDVADLDQQRCKLGSAPRIAAHGQSA